MQFKKDVQSEVTNAIPINKEKLGIILRGNTEIPLLDERVKILREIGVPIGVSTTVSHEKTPSVVPSGSWKNSSLQGCREAC